MIAAAHQPQFIPWLGFFDKMLTADVFVLLDDVQFKKNEWQNRNRIHTAQGDLWLTVPVIHHFGESIRQVKINNEVSWREKQLKTLCQTYSKARHFHSAHKDWEEMYGRHWESLCEINLFSIERLRRALGVATRLEMSSELGVSGRSTERLVNLCRKLGADTYLAGAGGSAYMDMALFEKAGIKVVFQEFEHPRYSQFGEAFVPGLSALDMLYHLGPQAKGILGGARP